MSALTLTQEDEGHWSLVYCGNTVGWIEEIKTGEHRSPRFRIESVLGYVRYCYSLNHARTTLLELYA